MASIQKFVGEGFHWLDVCNPSFDDLEDIAKRYSLHLNTVHDCLDSEHLPKFERLDNAYFLILRSFDEQSSPKSDTVQELTRKIAIFMSDSYLITVHRTDQPFLAAMREDVSTKESLHLGKSHYNEHFIRILKEVVHSFDRPIDRALIELEKFEMSVFGSNESAKVVDIQQGYFIKRRASVFKRVAKLTKDVIEKIDPSALGNNESLIQDVRESAESMYFYADELLESTNVLVNLHISISSQRTNQIMRTLTFFSLLIMPMNLIAGIYGMNFKFMPELEWTFGYPMALVFMLISALSFFFWFRSKGWSK